MNRLPVTVILVNYKTPHLTMKALDALYRSSFLPNEVILVDNNSEDGIEDMIAKKYSEVKFISNKINLGFAKANNAAIKISHEPYVWLLNNDTETGTETLKQLYDFMEMHQKVAAVSPSLIYPNGDDQSVGGYFPSLWNVLGYLLPLGYFMPENFKLKSHRLALYPQKLPENGLELDYVTGAASFTRKSALEKSGLLGEEYFMYFEETDLCWRLKKNGWKVMAIPTDPVMHVYGGSFKTKRDPLRLQLFLNSLKKFVNKNYSFLRRLPILIALACFGKLSIYLKTKRAV